MKKLENEKQGEKLKKMNGKEKSIVNKEFFITTIDDDGKEWVYSSEKFKLTELDFLNLIKMCYVHKRSISVGEKLIAIYRDCKTEAEKNLKNIGVELEEKINPTLSKGNKK